MIRHRNSTPLAPRRVVILGGTGFVGSQLVQELRAAGIPALGLGSSDFDLCATDSGQTLLELLEPADVLVFASALTPDKGNDIPTLMRNLRMAEGVASLNRSPVSHLIYISSDAVYDPADSLVRETTRPHPSSTYAHMHVVRERMFAHAAAQWDCPLLVVRPCAVYGPGDTHNSYGPNRFLRTALTEQRISLFGHGEEMRDHLFVRDLTRLLRLAILHRSEGLLNLATGQSVTFLAAASFVVGLCSHIVTLDHQPRKSPVTHRHYDVTELIRAFPTFQFSDLKLGLRAAIDSPQVVVAA